MTAPANSTLKLTPSRLSLLRKLADNGGGVMWRNIGGPGKSASAYLRMKGLAELITERGNTFQPNTLRLKITDAGRAALENDS